MKTRPDCSCGEEIGTDPDCAAHPRYLYRCSVGHFEEVFVYDGPGRPAFRECPVCTEKRHLSTYGGAHALEPVLLTDLERKPNMLDVIAAQHRRRPGHRVRF